MSRKEGAALVLHHPPPTMSPLPWAFPQLCKRDAVLPGPQAGCETRLCPPPELFWGTGWARSGVQGLWLGFLPSGKSREEWKGEIGFLQEFKKLFKVNVFVFAFVGRQWVPDQTVWDAWDE